MRMFIIILIGLAISTVSSVLIYKYKGINIPPSVGGLFLVLVWMTLPAKWTDKINGTKSEDEK